ncbi:MAG: YciI family protein [Pseudoclavibacter sp.]
MQYLLILAADESKYPADGSPEQFEEMAAWGEFSQQLVEAGAMRGGEALQLADTATSVRVRDGKPVVTDGPFAETKEALGGYYLIDVETIDEAIEWAKKVPIVSYGTVEIRPIVVFDEAEAPAGTTAAAQA